VYFFYFSVAAAARSITRTQIQTKNKFEKQKI